MSQADPPLPRQGSLSYRAFQIRTWQASWGEGRMGDVKGLPIFPSSLDAYWPPLALLSGSFTPESGPTTGAWSELEEECSLELALSLPTLLGLDQLGPLKVEEQGAYPEPSSCAGSSSMEVLTDEAPLPPAQALFRFLLLPVLAL